MLDRGQAVVRGDPSAQNGSGGRTMFHSRLVLWLVSVALTTSSVSAARDQTAMRVSIGGSELPANTEPRATVDAQLGAVDQARIRLTGVPAVGYASRIAAGEEVAIDALT